MRCFRGSSGSKQIMFFRSFKELPHCLRLRKMKTRSVAALFVALCMSSVRLPRGLNPQGFCLNPRVSPPGELARLPHTPAFEGHILSIFYYR